MDRLLVPDVDVFASGLNRQLDSYVSWRPDLMAITVDAFSMDWTDVSLYAFPPFSHGEQNTAEVVGGPGRGHSHCSVLDNTELVSSGNEELDSTSTLHPSTQIRICWGSLTTGRKPTHLTAESICWQAMFRASRQQPACFAKGCQHHRSIMARLDKETVQSVLGEMADIL